jgi:hypothetical protein
MSIPASRAVPYKATESGTRDLYRKMARASASYAKGNAEETWTAELEDR